MTFRSHLVASLSAMFLVAAPIAGCSDDETSNPSTGGQGGTAAGPTTGGSGGMGGMGGMDSMPNVYDTASSLADYSTLVAAVDKAGLAAALQDADATLTVFAPDNDAFADLLMAIGASSLDDLTAEQLRPILLYHVLGMEVDGAAATTAAEAGDKITGLGGSIQLAISNDAIQLDASAIVEVPDVEASNGIIHGISSVILPSITDVVVSDANFASLATALTVADMDASAPMLVETLDDNDGTFTVFAPPEDAFAGLVTALSGSASTGITALGDFAPYQLIPVLKYHVVAGAAVQAADVMAGPIGTLGGNVEAAIDPAVTIDGAAVTTANILTANGVIHVVDAVLVPSITDVVTTAPEFSSLAAAVVAADGDASTNPKVAPALDAAAAMGSYTLFAPDNDAFTALGTPPSGQTLTNVLLYHVLNEATPIYALDALGLGNPTGFGTLLGAGASAQITVSASNNSVILDDSGSAEDGAVNAANYFTSNGVIHKVDKVLLPE